MELTGDGGLLTGSGPQMLQTGLEVELEEHLSYEPYDPAGRNSGDSWNRTSSPRRSRPRSARSSWRSHGTKTARSGPMVQNVNVDSNGLAGNVISLYTKGMTTGRPMAVQASGTDNFGTLSDKSESPPANRPTAQASAADRERVGPLAPDDSQARRWSASPRTALTADLRPRARKKSSGDGACCA